MRPIFIFLILLAGTPFNAGADEEPRLYRVAVPVADLRGKPVEAASTFEHDRGQPATAEGNGTASSSRSHDPLEESQLLYGDPVSILEEKNGWAKVEAVDQMEWSHHHRWEGYPGWILLRELSLHPWDWSPNLIVRSKQGLVREAPSADAPVRMILSIGTRLVGRGQNTYLGEVEIPFRQLHLLDGTVGWIHAEEVVEKVSDTVFNNKDQVVEAARLFLGVPYYWGGRSADKVDCSGLVGLAYQASGFRIPRDAHEQWMKARAIARSELSVGDLIFLFDPKNRKRVSHVMLYAGQNRVIEGPGTGQSVREIDLDERLKEAVGRRVAFGTYLQ